jgi:hypothetical protein
LGGKSEQTTTQSSTTNPWEPAQGALKGILGQLNSYVPQAGATGLQGNAIDQINANNARFSSYAPSISGITNELLAGGGANNQAGAINQNYLDYRNATQPLASNTDYNPYNTPGFKDAISTLTSDITNGVNGSFAAAGRDFSGSNSQALGRGLTQGLAPTIAAQYNQNVQNQQGAAGNLYGAGNTNAGLLSGLQQQSLANKGAGISSIGAGLDASNASANSTIAAEAQRLGIPLQNLGLLAQIGVPIAGLGGQSTGTSNTQNQMSGVQQFMGIANGLTGLFGGGGSGGGGSLAGMAKFFSDRRLKEDVELVGTLFDGTPVYRYRYIGHPAFQIGLMAQDIEKVTPEAVEEINGFKAVDYKLATDKAVEAA